MTDCANVVRRSSRCESAAFQQRLAGAARQRARSITRAWRRPSSRCCDALLSPFRRALTSRAGPNARAQAFARYVKRGGRGAAPAGDCSRRCSEHFHRGRSVDLGLARWPDPNTATRVRRRSRASSRTRRATSSSTPTCSGRPSCSCGRGRVRASAAGLVDRHLYRSRRLGRPRRRRGLGQPGPVRARRQRRRAARRVQPARAGLGAAADDSRHGCARRRYAPFIDTLRANMRHAGALRIDHVMGTRAAVLDPRRRASGGTAPTCAIRSTTCSGLLALESHRHRCLVIGEDLGTVPDDVRTALAANDVLSYRVLLFERDATGAFKAPAAYPERALATASTHDLPTLAGWWDGHDIDAAGTSGLLASEDRVRAPASRSGSLRPCQRCCRRCTGPHRRYDRRLPGRVADARARRAALSRAHAGGANGRAARRRVRRARAGESAGHDRCTSELAAQASGAARSAGPDDELARFRDSCAQRAARQLRADAQPHEAAAFRARPTAATAPRVHVRRCHRDWSRISPRSASATSTARRTCARVPAAGTATTSSTTAR